MEALSEPTRRPGPDRLRELFAALAGGDPNAFEGIYESCASELHALALWRTGSPADAADAVHEVFVRLAGLRLRLKGIQDPLAYLRRMTHRAAVDVHRRNARRRETPIDDCVFVEPTIPSADRELDARRVSRLLRQLPPNQREALYLRHFSACSYAEIGRATGVPTFTAASRCRLGLRRLRILLGVDE
jgi:RNA polymerase sigma-70 factor (ECF subfamily)